MTLKLLLSGDSILQRRLQSRSDPELKPLFDKVRAADVAFTNLEVLANDYRGDPALESGGSHFGAPAWVLDCNCTICRRYGALWSYYRGDDQVKLITKPQAGSTFTYLWGDKDIAFELSPGQGYAFEPQPTEGQGIAHAIDLQSISPDFTIERLHGLSESRTLWGE